MSSQSYTSDMVKANIGMKRATEAGEPDAWFEAFKAWFDAKQKKESTIMRNRSRMAKRLRAEDFFDHESYEEPKKSRAMRKAERLSMIQSIQDEYAKRTEDKDLDYGPLPEADVAGVGLSKVLAMQRRLELKKERTARDEEGAADTSLKPSSDA